MRSRLAYELSHLQGPFGYLSRANLPGLSDDEYGSFIAKAKQCFDRSHEPFANHFRKKYGDSHELPPYWIIVESFDFGLISKLYKGAPKSVSKTAATRQDFLADVCRDDRTLTKPATIQDETYSLQGGIENLSHQILSV